MMGTSRVDESGAASVNALVASWSSHRNAADERGGTRSSRGARASTWRTETVTPDRFSTRTGAAAVASRAVSSEMSATKAPGTVADAETTTRYARTSRVKRRFARGGVGGVEDDAPKPPPEFFPEPPSSPLSSPPRPSPNPSCFRASDADEFLRTIPPTAPPSRERRTHLTRTTPTQSTGAGADHDHTPPASGRSRTRRGPSPAPHRVMRVSPPGGINDAFSAPG